MTPRVSGALVIISMVLTGCFGAYQVAPEAPLGVGGLKPTQEDQDAGRVGIATGFNLKDYPVIAVERFPVAKSEIEDQGDQRFADRMAFFYQAELVRRLREAGLFNRVVNLSETDLPVGAGKVLKLRGTITRLGRGSQAVRYLVGFGAGSTRAQAEMYFVDADSGQVMLVTADRRLASMGMFGGDDEDFLRESFNNMARDLVKFLTRLPKGERVASVATPIASAPATASGTVPVRSTAPVAELKALVGTWTGTMTGGGDLRVRHDVTLRFFEEGGEIRWEGHRRWATGESRGSGTVALSEDVIVLSGQRRESRSSSAIPVTFTLTRRGRTLEGTTLGSDNRVYMMALTRNQ
jgi:Domain of unknown function (DUF4410)